MKRILLFLLPLAGFCQKQSKPCDANSYSQNPSHDFFQTQLLTYQKENQLPGALLAVKQKGRPLWIGATGKRNLETGQDMEACTPLRLGSITKVYVAVAALQLQEQGKLDLNQKLSFYLPNAAKYIPESSAITLRMLLNHSSGIPDPKNDDPEYLDHITNNPQKMDSLSIDDRLQRYVYGKPLQFAPGTQSHYANSGYWLMGKVIEQASGKTLAQVLDHLIFRPLQLKHSYYVEKENPEVARGYFLLENKLQDVTLWDKADGDGDPSSGIISTVSDLYTFGAALFTGDLLSKKSMSELTTTLALANCPNVSCDYGLGLERWNIGNHAGFGKNGSSIGYEINWIYLPKPQLTLISFANKGGGSDKKFLELIAGRGN